jgi:uncharacterized protein (DUF433 family)
MMSDRDIGREILDGVREVKAFKAGQSNLRTHRLEEPSAATAMTFKRITVDPTVCGGKPCIRGLRFPVSQLLGLLASGETAESILAAYPYLEPEDIQEALSYAVFLADDV